MSSSNKTYTNEDYDMSDMDTSADEEKQLSDMDISADEEKQLSDMSIFSDDDDFQDPVIFASSVLSAPSTSAKPSKRKQKATQFDDDDDFQDPVVFASSNLSTPSTSAKPSKGKQKATQFDDDDDFQDPVVFASSNLSTPSTSAPKTPKRKHKAIESTDEASRKPVSKRIQRKIDKRDAVTKKRQQKRDGKVMKCPSCGGDDHMSANSPLCTKYKKKVDKGYHLRYFTVKTTLQDFCTSQRLRNEFKKLVPYFSKLMHVLSLFANFIVLHHLNKREPIPNLDLAYLYKLLTAMVGVRKHQDIVNLWARFCQETGFSTFENKQLSMVLSTIAKQFETNISNSIAATYEKRSLNFIKRAISNKNGPFFIASSKKHCSALAKYIWNKILGSQPKWPLDVDKTVEAQNTVNDLVLLYISQCSRIPTESDVFANATAHIPWSYYILKDVESIQYEITQRASTRVPSRYIKEQLKTIIDMSSLSPKSISSLVHALGSLLNNNKQINIKNKKLRGISEWNAINTWCDQVKDQLTAGTFEVPRYVFQRNNHLFTLLPIYSAAPKHWRIDKQTLWKLLKDLSLRQPGTMSEDLISQAYASHFKYRKLLPTKQFCYTFTTDGYSVCLQYKQTIKNKDKNAEPFTPKCLRQKIHNAEIWGIDPGISSIITATNNHSETRSISNSEYYTYIKVASAKSFLAKHDLAHATIVERMKHQKSLKVSSVAAFLQASREAAELYQDIYNYHLHKPKSNFEMYMNKQKALAEFCKFLDNNKSKKYKQRPQTEDVKIYAFGAANFQSSLKGVRAAPTRKVKAALKSYAIANKYYFIEVDEYLTSQICNICGTRTLEHMECQDKKQKLHAVLKCTNCLQPFNRDVNASINIRDIFIHMALNDDSRPQRFQSDENK